jgi:hypothetical protein
VAGNDEIQNVQRENFYFYNNGQKERLCLIVNLAFRQVEKKIKAKTG